MEDCHPQLRGGRKKGKGYIHGLSTNQIEVMASMCETLFPSIPLNKENSQDQVISSFYTTSGSQFPLPDE
ncbi:long-chain-alcohol oxidase FAO1-like protein, partial [Trifolium pratense]